MGPVEERMHMLAQQGNVAVSMVTGKCDQHARQLEC